VADQGDEEKDQEYYEQDFRNTSCRNRYARKAHNRCNQRDHEKYKRPIKHRHPPEKSQAQKYAVMLARDIGAILYSARAISVQADTYSSPVVKGAGAGHSQWTGTCFGGVVSSRSRE
jgi:hypothetical protein